MGIDASAEDSELLLTYLTVPYAHQPFHTLVLTAVVQP